MANGYASRGQDGWGVATVTRDWGGRMPYAIVDRFEPGTRFAAAASANRGTKYPKIANPPIRKAFVARDGSRMPWCSNHRPPASIRAAASLARGNGCLVDRECNRIPVETKTESDESTGRLIAPHGSHK